MYEQIRTQRIDGTDYQVGTPEHRMALAARAARHDAAYLERHHHLMERNLRAIRESDLDDRIRHDANYSAFLARELVFTRAAVERRIYDRLRAAEYVPVEGGHPRGAKSYATQIMDEAGDAKISHDLAGDAPRADVAKTEDLRRYVNVRASYAYSLDDLEAAALAGTSLVREKAMACANAIARKLDLIGRSGDAASGLTGFFNNSTVTVTTLTNGEWTTATADELVADLQQIESALITAARDNQPESYHLVLPTTYEGVLMTKPRATGSDMSVGKWFLANSRLIKSISRWQKLDDASGADIGASDAPQGICFPTAGGGMKGDPSVFFWPFSIQYEEQPPEVRGYEWIVNARSRCGGVEFRQPKLVTYVENLD